MELKTFSMNPYPSALAKILKRDTLRTDHFLHTTYYGTPPRLYGHPDDSNEKPRAYDRERTNQRK